MQNKKVLTIVLKVLKHVSCLISRGSELKSLGAATANALLPSIFLVLSLYGSSSISLFCSSSISLFCQSALYCEQHKDSTPSFRVDSSEKGLLVVIFCYDLPVKRCEGDRA